MEGVVWVSEVCGEAVSRCGEVVWKVWRGCLDVVGDSLKGVGRLSGGYGEAAWKVWVGCLEGVVRLCRVCAESVWRVWGGFM